MVASDTTCTNASNGSRICTLIKAATQFVNTLTAAISSAQQLYISVVPYVTTVNVGNALCTGATSCSGIATTGGDFTDLRGNIMPVTPIVGTTTSGSTTISSVSMLTPSGSVSGTAAIQQGMYIYGHGIPTGATVSSVSGSSIVDFLGCDPDLHRQLAGGRTHHRHPQHALYGPDDVYDHGKLD